MELPEATAAMKFNTATGVTWREFPDSCYMIKC